MSGLTCTQSHRLQQVPERERCPEAGDGQGDPRGVPDGRIHLPQEHPHHTRDALPRLQHFGQALQAAAGGKVRVCMDDPRGKQGLLGAGSREGVPPDRR